MLTAAVEVVCVCVWRLLNNVIYVLLFLIHSCSLVTTGVPQSLPPTITTHLPLQPGIAHMLRRSVRVVPAALHLLTFTCG